MIGVCYPDKYAVEETFQLLKVPWEWYAGGHQYDVVIARKADVDGYTDNLIDLEGNDCFKKISMLLNTGEPHLHEPVCEMLLDKLRQDLKKYTLLVEIPPVPFGHPYLVALTHDVDVTSVRECRILTAGYAAYQCFRQGNFRAGLRLACARLGIGSDPWVLFLRWKTLESELGVRSTFFFVPKKDDPGVRAHQYRPVRYDIDRDTLNRLTRDGWEVGVHGLDNWADAEAGKRERDTVGNEAAGNRTHWLLFDEKSWSLLEQAGYSYDTTFGYNDDAGFRAGTLQAYRPDGTDNLLELPLHIQDIGLFGKSCWAPAAGGWEKMPCLHLSESGAAGRCNRILDFAGRYGGAVTFLWHYENITPPKDWSGLYKDLVNRAKTDGAWVTTAGNVVAWFRMRRQARISCTHGDGMITISTENIPTGGSLPPLTLRIHVPDNRQVTANTGYLRQKEYIDILLTKKTITVSFP
ncbi:hypothetical protein [uncultured Methanoregula sp.]|uniref:hypothetical protein n=1 Tax=uncultured Methanoregula sp. TaxID=1005933 RepID=UPI002AABDA72|nr:hypothetical protein [uncultured Methanoregula sp.]